MPAAVPSSPLEAAVSLHRAGRVAEALERYRRLRRAGGRDFKLLHLGGAALLQSGEAAEAVEWLQAAAALQPSVGATRMCLALALAQVERRESAAGHFEAALKLEPRNVELLGNYALFQLAGGRPAAALDALTRAAALAPRDPKPLHQLGRVLLALGRPAEALARHEAALAIAPEDSAGHTARAQALSGCHRIEEALAAFDRALALDPSNRKAASHRLLLLHYLDDQPREAIARAHFDFGRLCAGAVAPGGGGLRAREPEKRLRVGFLSPDLRRHSVAYFLEPLLAHLPREQFEIFLYHDHFSRDAVTERLRAQAAGWRDLSGREDAWAERVIRADAPDLLVELAGHTGFNRLPLLARRLAPVQISYLGYPDTTGLATMDYRFTDAWADPPGETEALHRETLVRFAETAWCYQAPADAPPPAPPPCLAGGGPVFGSFNNLGKLSPATLRLWAGLLAAVPTARLLIKGYQADGAFARRAIAAGIPEARLITLPPCASVAEHLGLYARVDVALDPLPYHGTTTTCEALWMGRPVLTLAGDRHVNRVGVSLLKAVGEDDLITTCPADYVARAVALVSDPAALAARSAGLRERVRASALLDHAGQAERFAKALRACWKERCALHASAAR
jgi:predicted O-linked N-acetylglucosamine transferase (SPINDLY family)